jgi:DNA-binding transcriptional ArsR family regulator
MRPAANKQSALRAPLNDILGTEASVRILRVLVTATVPLNRGEIAARTALHTSGVPRVLSKLENLGVIESIGRGRSRPLQLRAAYPLLPQIRALFLAEADRARNVVESIVGALSGLNPRPDAAWIEGSVASETDAYDDPIIVGVLAGQKADQQWEHQLRDSFRSLQANQDVALEVRIRWRADIHAANKQELATLKNARPLIGPPPLDLLGLSEPDAGRLDPKNFSSHEIHDATALRFARAIAEALKTKPDLVDDALRFLDRRLPLASEQEQSALREWHDILSTYSPGRLRAFLVRESEQAQRLRQSLPFVFALSQSERDSLRREPATTKA